MWWHHKKVAIARIDELGLLEGALARVVGRAVSLGEEFQAPYTSRQCLAVTSTIDVQATVGNTNTGPTVNGAELVARFGVDDGSGRIVVTPQALKLEIECHFVNDERAADPHAAHRFGASIIDRELRSLGKTGPLDLSEGVLVAGDAVAIIGHVKKTDVGWELVAGPKEPLIISTHANQLT